MEYPKTMKALVAYSRTDYRNVEDFPVPELGPDDKKLRSVNRIQDIKILDHTSDFSKIELECQAENAGVIELERI